MENKYKILILIICLMGSVLVPETLAYFTYKSNTPIKNTYTLSQGISVEIDEGNWNENNAINILPGSVVAKEPALKNTSNGDMAVYGAIRITYVKGTGQAISLSEYESYIKADDNFTLIGTDDAIWEADDKNQTSASKIFYYRKDGGKIAPNAITEPLFRAVGLNPDISADDVKVYNDWHGINIRVEGAAVQSGLQFTQGNAAGEFSSEYEYAKFLLNEIFEAGFRH